MSQPARYQVAHRMFRCAICQKVTQPGTPLQLVVTQFRKKQYAFRTKPKRIGLGSKPPSQAPSKIVDWGGSGWEIVREIGVCPPCARDHPGANLPPRKAKIPRGLLPRGKNSKKQPVLDLDLEKPKPSRE